MKQARRIHTWFGVFFAPAILFFACSGLAMTLGLHKNNPETGAEPTSWIAKLAEIHRKQSAAPIAPRASKAASDKPTAEKATVVFFRGFVVLMCGGIVVTTVLGLWMALSSPRGRRAHWALLCIGTALPIAFLCL